MCCNYTILAVSVSCVRHEVGLSHKKLKLFISLSQFFGVLCLNENEMKYLHLEISHSL